MRNHKTIVAEEFIIIRTTHQQQNETNINNFLNSLIKKEKKPMKRKLNNENQFSTKQTQEIIKNV